MLAKRIIPCLLINADGGLIKTIKFRKPNYIGDPLNAVKIYNEKQVDELILLDITASRRNSPPNFKLLEKIASECFIPLAYGGGIKTIEDMSRLFSLGIEKIILNSVALELPHTISEAAHVFGKQSIVVNVNTKLNFFKKHKIYDSKKGKLLNACPLSYVKQVENLGAGEIMITSVDRDGTFQGYDVPFLRKVVSCTNIPVVGCGGAGTLDDLQEAFAINVQALAAGSLFIYQRMSRSVLINYPNYATLESLWGNK